MTICPGPICLLSPQKVLFIYSKKLLNIFKLNFWSGLIKCSSLFIKFLSIFSAFNINLDRNYEIEFYCWFDVCISGLWAVS